MYILKNHDNGNTIFVGSFNECLERENELRYNSDITCDIERK